MAGVRQRGRPARAGSRCTPAWTPPRASARSSSGCAATWVARRWRKIAWHWPNGPGALHAEDAVSGRHDAPRPQIQSARRPRAAPSGPDRRRSAGRKPCRKNQERAAPLAGAHARQECEQALERTQAGLVSEHDSALPPGPAASVSARRRSSGRARGPRGRPRRGPSAR
jgi:hypothetical protein